MEDENGLELSLGLSCAGSSAKSKGKNENSSDTKTEEGNDFKSFLQGSDSVKPRENFFNDLSKAGIDADTSRNFNGRMFFDDPNNKRKRETHHTEQHEKAKTSHISITTEEGSTAENEDVAESVVEDLTSKLVSNSHPDDLSKQFAGKEVRGFADSSIVDLQAKKRFNNGSSVGNVMYGVPFPVQPMNMSGNSAGALSSSSALPFGGVMQMMSAESGGRSGNQTVTPGNSPLLFGYSPVQLPLLDKDNSLGLVSHPQHFHPSFGGRSPGNSDKHIDGLKMSQAAMHASEAPPHDKTLEQAKGDTKQHATEEGSSSQSHTEDMKGSSTNLRAKDPSDRSAAEGFSLDFSAIKPGIAADLKFGGCGSHPNLPWVSTTAPGPNGRTISGVTYRFSTNQIKIVCACHGTHMSPEEFVRHAAEPVNPGNNGTVSATFPRGNGNVSATFPSGNNPAASAQS